MDVLFITFVHSVEANYQRVIICLNAMWRQNFWASRQQTTSCEELITCYFSQGITREKILLFLDKYHGLKMSLRTLKRKLSDLGLRRKNSIANLEVVRDRIRKELDDPGSSGCYRSIWHSQRLEEGKIAE